MGRPSGVASIAAEGAVVVYVNGRGKKPKACTTGLGALGGDFANAESDGGVVTGDAGRRMRS